MRPTIVLMAVVCWSTPYTIAAAETQCVSFSDSIDGVNKDRTVEKSLRSLNEQIEKWKADSGVTGPVTVTLVILAIQQVVGPASAQIGGQCGYTRDVPCYIMIIPSGG